MKIKSLFLISEMEMTLETGLEKVLFISKRTSQTAWMNER